MARMLAYLMVCMAVAGMLLLVVVAASDLAADALFWLLITRPRATAVALAASAGAALAAAAWYCLRRSVASRRERRIVRAAAPTPAGGSLARRLLGDYPPYVVEAALDLGGSGSPAAAPLLLLALERLLVRPRPAWREMAGAMASALARLGDARALRTLRRLRDAPGAEEIEGLDAAIAALESATGLLRPACTPAYGDCLLRPAAGTDCDPALLLRPSVGSSDAVR